ncbi:frizzled-3-like [Engraulis encrasicolus]|uniref:frizzled-3-like n=1 Tax=Engraulis encrasicolus TaxID=184585 RepID=UPI002FD495EF
MLVLGGSSAGSALYRNLPVSTWAPPHLYFTHLLGLLLLLLLTLGCRRVGGASYRNLLVSTLAPPRLSLTHLWKLVLGGSVGSVGRRVGSASYRNLPVSRLASPRLSLTHLWTFVLGSVGSIGSAPHRNLPVSTLPSPRLSLTHLWTLLLGVVVLGGRVGSAIHLEAAQSHSSFTCEPIGLRMCQELPYNNTFMPNLLNHYDQQTAALAMEPFHPMVNLACSSDLRGFLCALYAPVCMEYGRVALPCRSLCLNAKRDCHKLMDMFGVAWPDEMECSRFPDCEESYPRAVDLLTGVQTTEEPAVSVQRDYGFWCPRELKVDPDLGYSFLGARDCSAPCPSMHFARDQLTLARYLIGASAILCLTATLFTCLTFLIDVTRFRYPERPIIFYALCYLVVALVFLLGFLLEERVACNAASPSQFRASTVTQGSHNKVCTLLFMALYFFSTAGGAWWVVLTLTWFLAAVPKWGSEAIEKKALLFHAAAWGLPGLLTVTLLALNKTEGDGVSGVCFVGLYDVTTLRWFVLAPQCANVVLGVALLLAGIVALNRVRMEIPLEKENQDKLVKFMIRIGVFSALYLAPLLTVIGCLIYEQSNRALWDGTWVKETCREYHIPCPYQVEESSRPVLVLLVLKYVMGLVVGVPSVFWISSRKTCSEWASFLHGRRQRKDSAVNESRQVLQEVPGDFAASLLLRDPTATPVVRKSRGTSTQGTSTRASSARASSSAHLNMADDDEEEEEEPTSRPTSPRYHGGSTGYHGSPGYHGSLHRNRDGRYTGCTYRGPDERSPYGSMPRLQDQLSSNHGSLRDLDSLSRQGSQSRSHAPSACMPLPSMSPTHAPSLTYTHADEDLANA